MILFSFFCVPLVATQRNAQRSPHFLPRQADSHSLDHLHQQSYLQQKARNFRRERELYPIEQDRWDYWSVGLGAGLGMITERHADGKIEKGSMPDVRLGLERSIYLNDNWTLSFDISLLTPAIRLGCIINENTRITVGFHYWMLRRLHVNESRGFRTTGPKEESTREPYSLVNQFLVSPAVSVDHFFSRNSFLRGTFSYDLVHRYSDAGELQSKWYWPQFLLTLNLRF